MWCVGAVGTNELTTVKGSKMTDKFVCYSVVILLWVHKYDGQISY